MTARRTPEEIEALWLRASALRRRMEELPGKLNDWVVLSHGGDPAQITRARFDNALWLSDWWVRAKLRMGIGDIHTRGMHYALFGEIKPNGETYGTRQDWRWLKKTSGDARWYGLIPWTEIIDQKNDTPFVWTPNPAQPTATVVADYDFYLPTLEDLTPTVALGANGRDGENGIDRGGLIPEQPYRIAMIGEKTSLRRILLPLAQRNNADLVLFSGDGSNTLLYDMLRRAAEDGRLLVVLYFSDADPSGWDMVPSVSYKLAAIRDINFPEVEFITHRVGLTPYQVMAYNSDHPDAPLPEAPDPEEDEETDKVNGQKVRRDRWRDRWNIGQIEIDALMTRDPDLLTEMAENAILSFHDEGLTARTLRVQRSLAG